MRQLIALLVFVLFFGIGTAHAQKMNPGLAGGGSAGPTNNGGGGGGGGDYGGGGGSSAIAGVTHHALWNPPPNVSAQNDGPFTPSSYQTYDKAVEMGKNVAETKGPTIVEVAKATQEQRAAGSKSRITMVQDVDGRVQEVKVQP